jgi:hypothetical protein
MNPHDNEEEKNSSIASEPQMAYGNAPQTTHLQYNYPQNIPEGYMSLEQFGEVFHQKLDDCYAHLPSNN